MGSSLTTKFGSLAVAAIAVFSVGAVVAPSAGATSLTTFPAPTVYGNASHQTQDGTVTISGAGLVYTVTVNLSAGTTFSTVNTPALQICASTSAFTSKAAGNANCTGTANGVFNSYSVTGSSATESVTLPSAFNNVNAYFEVLSDTNDSGVENTSAGCPISATPLYGSCSVPFVAVDTPSGGVIGIISAAALAAGGFTYVTIRRRRRSQRVA